MALSKEQIQSEVEERGFKLSNAGNYKNLDSEITVQCELNHLFITTINKLRKNDRCPQCTRLGVNLEEKVPRKEGYRIIALDQASNYIGISIWDDGKLVHARRERLLGEYTERLAKLYRFLTQIVIGQWQPDELVFEDIQYQNNAVTHKVLGGVLGVCQLAAEMHKIPQTAILNKVWQAEFGIKGTSRQQQKSNTVATVDRLFNIATNDDIADSILLGYYRVLKQSAKWDKRIF